jgi:N-acetylmuramoyl-L-alanine amidase CwlA
MTINQGKPCHSSNYSSRGGSSIKYIVIHFTANNGDTAQNNCTYFSGANRNASAHYFVGDDGIYQSVPDAYKAWHCGGTSYYKHPYCRNANSIGIEMCSRIDGSGHYYIRDGIISQTVELTRYLMDKYGIPADNVIRHYDVWDKDCPEPFVRDPQLWEDFKKRLSEEDLTVTQYEELKAMIADLQAENAEIKAENEKIKNAIGGTFIYDYIDKNMPSWAHDAVKWCVDKGIITGTGKDVNGTPTLGLNHVQLWACTVLYRLSKLVKTN